MSKTLENERCRDDRINAVIVPYPSRNEPCRSSTHSARLGFFRVYRRKQFPF